jgi:hypothetical protein
VRPLVFFKLVSLSLISAPTPALIFAGAKEAITSVDYCFVASPTINIPLLPNIESLNSLCKLISTQIEEICKRKKLGSPNPNQV